MKGGRFDRSGPGQLVGQWVPSGESWFPNEWPGSQFLYGANRQVNPPSYPLVAEGMPAYPDGTSAINHVWGIDSRGGHTWDSGVFFFFPDYRARITQVTLGVEHVSLKVLVCMPRPDDVVGKIYARSKEGTVVQKDFDLVAAEDRIDFGLSPEFIYVGILCKSDGQILDEWTFSPYRQSSKVKVELFTPQYVQQLISQGEDSHVEFKPGIKDDNAKRELAESAIAFANKNGGTILIGIDDNARIQGAYGDGWEDMLIQSLRDRCEPPIEPTVRHVVLEDKPVYVVEVNESHNKPHLTRGTSIIYIRVASTDKPVTRDELDEMFNRKREQLDLQI
ncbi:ATP-binding protein [bacterium]|nr:ATP-binding protein [bacterium]